MQAEIVRFWRYLPRLSLGLIMSVELVGLIMGPSIFERVPSAMKAVRSNFGDFGSTTLLVVCAMLAGAMGVLLLEALNSVAGSVLALARRITPLDRLTKSSLLRGCLVSPVALAGILYRENKKLLLDYQYQLMLGSLLVRPSLEDPKALVAQTVRRLDEHMELITNWRLALHQSYFNQLHVEQREEDHLRWEVGQAEHVCWIALGMLLLVPRLGIGIHMSSLWWLFPILILVGVLPLLSQRRRRLAAYYCITYLSSLRAEEGAEVVDREPI